MVSSSLIGDSERAVSRHTVVPVPLLNSLLAPLVQVVETVSRKAWNVPAATVTVSTGNTPAVTLKVTGTFVPQATVYDVCQLSPTCSEAMWLMPSACARPASAAMAPPLVG